MSERNFYLKVKAVLQEKGAYFIKTTGGPHQPVGIPDIIACYKGRFVALELKRPGQKPTPIQKEHLLQIRRAGGRAFAVTTLPQVHDILNNIETMAQRQIEQALKYYKEGGLNHENKEKA